MKNNTFKELPSGFNDYLQRESTMQVNGIGKGFHLNMKDVGDDIVYSCMKVQAGYNSGVESYDSARIQSLQYANKLLVSRAVDANGTYTTAVSNNTVKTVNEFGKVEIVNAPTEIFVGSFIKFNKNADNTGEYKVTAIEAPVTAVAQVSEIDVTDNLAEGESVGLEIVYNGNTVSSSFTAPSGGSTASEAATGLADDISSDTNGVTAEATGTKIVITATVAGVATIFNEITSAKLNQITVTTENVEGESYELVLSDYRGADDLDFTEIAVTGSEIYVRDSAMNAIAAIPVAATYVKDANGIITSIATPATALKTGDELKSQALFIPNDSAYELMEASIPNDSESKLKFFAKNSGDMQNYTEIAIARQKDFDFGSALVFDGIPLNDFFENKPLEAAKEIAVVIRQFGKVTSSYIVSLIPGNKDYRNKSNYIEDIINKYDLLVYVKDNTDISGMPQSRLYSTVEPTLVTDASGNTSIKDMPVMNGPVKTSNGTNGIVGVDDIISALGNVSDNTIFGRIANITTSVIYESAAA